MNALLRYGTITVFALLLVHASREAELRDYELSHALLYLAGAILVGLAGAAAWAGWFGERFSGLLVERFTDTSDLPAEPGWMAGWLDWLERRGWNRLLRWSCYVVGQHAPRWPAVFLKGLNAARPGSRLERHFAERVYAFENPLNALKAWEVLARHGVRPKSHPSMQVNLFILRAVAPEPPPVDVSREIRPEGAPAPVPPPDRVPVKEGQPVRRPGRVTRNPAIRLFDEADATSFVWKQVGGPEIPASRSVAAPFARASTTILFTPPVPPQAPFRPVRVPAAPQRRA